MSTSSRTNIEESIKRFLIVGETLQGLHSYVAYHYRNLLTAIVLLLASIFAFTLGRNSPTWYILSFGFFSGGIYFLVLFRVKLSYGITKYRVIRILEGNFFSSFFYRSSRFVGFSDLHYEHVERISIEAPSMQMPRLYLSLAAISFGWIILGEPYNIASLDLDIGSLSGILAIIAGAINFMFAIPTGGVKLVLKSVSGETMEFPEKSTPRGFIDTLILNCRTFLSYGAR